MGNIQGRGIPIGKHPRDLSKGKCQDVLCFAERKCILKVESEECLSVFVVLPIMVIVHYVSSGVAVSLNLCYVICQKIKSLAYLHCICVLGFG